MEVLAVIQLRTHAAMMEDIKYLRKQSDVPSKR